MKKLSDNIIKEIVNLKKSGLSRNQIVKELGISLGAVKTYLWMYGLKEPKKEPLAEEQIKKIIELHNQGIGFKGISKRVGCANSTARNWLVKRTMYKPLPMTRPRKYQVNENFFEEINTEKKAYWLGFLAADGCVCIRQNPKLMLQLQTRDKSHMEMFIKDIDANHRIRHVRYKKYNWVSLQICSKKICNDLMSKGVVPQKSKILDWPSKVPNNLIRHFLRGYFDGDGCWWVKTLNHTSFISNDASATWVGSSIFMKKVSNYLVKQLGMNRTKLIRNSASVKEILRLSNGGNRQCKKLYDFFYKDANVWLDRKKKKVDFVLNDYVFTGKRRSRKNPIS